MSDILPGKTLERKNMETERLHRILTRQGKPYVCAIMDDEKATDMMNGKPSDVLYMLHCLYHSAKAELMKQYGEPLTEKMMRRVSMTDDELNKELKTLLEEKKIKEIPAWLKKLMDIDFDEDDISYDDEEDDDDTDLSTDEVDRDETEDGDEDDEPVSYTFRGNGLRLDISVHSDDAVRNSH